MDAVDLNTYQLYMKLMSGDANAGQASFFQPPPPPQAPMLRLGGDRWAVDPAGSSYVAAAHGPVDLPMQGGNDFVYGLVPGAGNGTLAPGEDSLTIGGDVFVGNDQFVHGLPCGVEDPLLRMSDADLSAFMSDEAAVNSLCMPPEYLMSSLAAYQTAMADSPPVPPAAGPSQSSSGSPSLGAQARATDSPVDGAYPPVDYPQAASVDAPQQVPDNEMNGDNLSAFMNTEPAVNSLCMPPEYLMSLLAAYQPLVPPAAGLSQSSSDSPGMGAQVRATDSPAPTSQMGAYPTVLDYPPAASIDAPQQVPDKEMAEVADMVHVAARCSDKPSTAWSESEHQLLLQGLSRFADQDKINKCFNIASGLAEKTVLDVAYRIRWLSDLEKKEAAKQAQLGQEKSAGGNVTKGKGTKVANKKNNKHPLSKEALDSRSAKDIIRDNNRLMDKIEEILRSGQVKNSPDYFYYVKMNMDAMQNKVRDLASVMEGLLVGDEEWEDVLKDRDAPQAGHEAATPAP